MNHPNTPAPDRLVRATSEFERAFNVVVDVEPGDPDLFTATMDLRIAHNELMRSMEATSLSRLTSLLADDLSINEGGPTPLTDEIRHLIKEFCELSVKWRREAGLVAATIRTEVREIARESITQNIAEPLHQESLLSEFCRCVDSVISNSSCDEPGVSS